ncbi:MAG: deoxyribodipyrimidine photo-lyase [Desulfohalobiaceae bacterium]|nr:deoxyribodipyrimidine photo-lyase [Desulfohalobiaceae bacterium]
MQIPPIETTRIQPLNHKHSRDGKYVLYWMQQSQRAEHNPALEYAIAEANRIRLPVLVVFGLSQTYPEANLRHFTFMLQGLQETKTSLADRKILLAVQKGTPPEVAIQAARGAALLVCDRGYLRHQKRWREQVADAVDCQVIQVEGEVLVPTHVVSSKQEHAARTIRPKIHRHLPRYLLDCPSGEPRLSSLDMNMESLGLSDLNKVLKDLRTDRDILPVDRFFKGGTRRAKKIFADFTANRLERYPENRNQPQTDDVSHMGMFLHFGQISPVWLALTVYRLDSPLSEPQEVFLEELIVRRELAVNFVEHTPDYDRYSCIPAWAARTLDEHRDDPRPCFTPEELEAAETHDPYWNAAMKEMKASGYMHNYMRMYWGKKILEWSREPKEGFALALRLNNRYFLDGRDPNSYAGVAWIFGVHDRGWPQRPAFGKVRSMTAKGLERKCDIKGYVDKVEALCQRDRSRADILNVD